MHQDRLWISVAWEEHITNFSCQQKSLTVDWGQSQCNTLTHTSTQSWLYLHCTTLLLKCCEPELSIWQFYLISSIKKSERCGDQ